MPIGRLRAICVLLAGVIGPAFVIEACSGSYGETGSTTDAAPQIESSTPEPDAGALPDATLETSSVSTDAATDAKIDAAMDANVDAGPLGPWTAMSFTDQNRLGTCTGAKYVAYSYRYSLYVGVILCSATRYKMYLSKTLNGIYYEVGDGSGGGEDHCELVSPSFTLGVNGLISGGNCPTCAFNYAGTGVIGMDAGAFTRQAVGDVPLFKPVWPQGYYTGHWYECGVSIP